MQRNLMLAVMLLTVALACSRGFAQSRSAVVKQEFIYETAPFPECHAATIVQTKAGTLLCAWFGGTEEKHTDVGIWLSRWEDNKWSTPVEVANGVQDAQLRYPTWNPVLFQPGRGELKLYFKVGPAPDDWWGEVISSGDDGRTWHGRERLPNRGIGPVKNKPIELADGTILCPSSDEADGWTVHIESTQDLGKSWTKIGPLNDGKKIRAIQPTFLRMGADKLGMLSRDGQNDGNIWQSWSSDNGQSWTPFEASSLPNPNSGIDAVTLASGKHLLVYNHTKRSGPRPNGREHLGVALSDDGQSWKAALTLEQARGEYSYPAVIQTQDRLVHIVYTWNRKRVRHVVIDPKQLQSIEMAEGKWPSNQVAKLPAAE